MICLQPYSYSYNSLLRLCVYFCVVSYSCSHSWAQDDLAAMLKVKEQLGNSSKFGASTNYCWWNYITCNSAGRVRTIFLDGLDINAPLPSAIGDLTELETLSIQQMPGLHGSIPESFGKLSHLQIFNLMVTSVTGPIPDSLSNTNLTSMALFRNLLTGAIPASLSKLPYLGFLDLSNNSLTGNIPPGLVKGSPTVPAYLILHHNNLTGKLPRSYSGRYFDTVNVGYNHLTGNPSFLFRRNTRFFNINLSGNNFKFDLTHVKLPDTLRFLELGHNNIRGKVPKSLVNIRVAVLDLSYNQLCGEIPTGGYMSWHHAKDYEHNKCLCGTPLPPCTKGSSPPPAPPSVPPSVPPSNPPPVPHSVPPSIPPSVPSSVPPVSPPSVPSSTPPSYPSTIPPSLPPSIS